jgi:hypothetical protein
MLMLQRTSYFVSHHSIHRRTYSLSPVTPSWHQAWDQDLWLLFPHPTHIDTVWKAFFRKRRLAKPITDASVSRSLSLN